MSAISRSALSSTTTPSIIAVPINGMGGSLYNTPISLPLYHHNDTSLTNTTSYAAIDAITSFTMVNLVPHTIALSFSVLTLLHALLLVPPRKRHSSMFVLLTLCLALQTITSSAAVYLNVYGGYAASYPLLTRDVVTSHYSTGYRTTLVIFHLASVLILLPLNVAFYILSRSLLTWVRLKFTRYAYFGILGYLLFNTFMWVSFRMALAGYTINNIALVSVLDPLLTTRWAWKFFKTGEGVSGSVCVAAWSCTIGAASVSVLRARREFFRIEQRTSGTRKVVGERTAFDVSLNLLAIVGVQSFIVPVFLCIMHIFTIKNVEFVAVFDPEVVIVPVTLCLLSIGSLFVNATSSPVMVEWTKMSADLDASEGGR